MPDVLVKVCGITRLEDALVAEQAGADMIGFVFAESPRRVAPDIAARISQKIKTKKVGVFVDQPPETVNRIVRDCGLDYAQLHGSETQQVCDEISIPVIKAVRVKNADDLRLAGAYDVFRLLLDAYVTGTLGGTGATFDWELLSGFDSLYILAGGLGPDNVGQAVQKLAPWAVDASSRLESSPGIKCCSKIAAFVAAVKGASNAAG